MNDVKDAISDWNYSITDVYHEDGEFCIDVTFDDTDEWAENSDDIWNSLCEVCDDWGAGLDSDCNNYYIAIDMDDDDEEDNY